MTETVIDTHEQAATPSDARAESTRQVSADSGDLLALVPARPDTPVPVGDEQEVTVSEAGARELAQLRQQLALVRQRTMLLADPAWSAEMSPREREAERETAAQIRAMYRKNRLDAALADGTLSAREQRMDARLSRLALSDRLWSRRAQARRRRLMDPTSRLAALQRTHVASSAALLAVASAGIAWTAAGVHDALVGGGGSILAYAVEPIFSIPLLVIMSVAARAAQFGRVFPPPHQRLKVYLLKGFLLASTVALNTSSVVPGIGQWVSVTTLLAHLVPPLLIVVAVMLQPLVAAFLADVLISARVDTDSTVPPRLDSDVVDTLHLVHRVRQAVARGELPVWEDELPSITAIRSYLRCEKRRAQGVWDALAILAGSTRGGHAA
jgi:hypothetical protein